MDEQDEPERTPSTGSAEPERAPETPEGESLRESDDEEVEEYENHAKVGTLVKAKSRPVREPLEHTRLATCEYESDKWEMDTSGTYDLMRFDAPVGGVAWTLALQIKVDDEEDGGSLFCMQLVLKDVAAEHRDRLCVKIEATVSLTLRSRSMKTVTVKKLLNGNGAVSLYEETEEPRKVTLVTRVHTYYRNPPCAACADWNRLRDCRELAEVTFTLADDGADVPAHKQVLCARSPVFRSMFTHDFKESRESKVVVEGVSLPVFLKFLEFLYSGQVQDFEGLELDVLLVADRYQVDGLKVLCQSEMFDKVNTSNVLETLILADKVNAPLLKANALSVVVHNMKAVMMLPKWRDFHRERNDLVDDVLKEALMRVAI